jgi:hypothetical protein
VPLGASVAAAPAAAGGCLPAACTHIMLQEFAPETAAALPSSFLEKLGPPWVHGLPKVQMGQVRAGEQQVLASCSG